MDMTYAYMDGYNDAMQNIAGTMRKVMNQANFPPM
jgi:hypothetical protein